MFTHSQWLRPIYFLLLLLIPAWAVSQDLCTGLVAHYPFDRNFEDLSGNDNHGITEGVDPHALPKLVADRFGNPQAALQFDGTDDFISYINRAQLQPSLPMTVSAWVKLDKYRPGLFFRNDYRDDFYDGIWVGINASGNFNCSFGDGGGISSSNRRSVTSNYVLPLNEWHHVTYVISSATNMKIYVDGIDQCVVGTCTPSGSGGALQYQGNNALSGKSDPSAQPNTAPKFFDGSLDDLRLYDRALPLPEINLLAETQSNSLSCSLIDETRFMFPASLAGNQFLCGSSPQHEMVEMGLKLTNNVTFAAPADKYDFKDIKAILVSPSGQSKEITPYFYEPFALEYELKKPTDPNASNYPDGDAYPQVMGVLNNSPFVYLDDNDPNFLGTAWHTALTTEFDWRLRFRLEEVGTWFLQIQEKQGNTWQNCGQTYQLDCVASEHPGRPHFDNGTNSNYLAFPNGETFLPVGESLPFYGLSRDSVWAEIQEHTVHLPALTGQPQDYLPSHVFQYEYWLKELAENNGNFIRIILAPWTFDLEWQEVGNYDAYLNRAEDLDWVLRFCEDNGIYLQLSVFDHTAYENYVAPNTVSCDEPAKEDLLYYDNQAYHWGVHPYAFIGTVSTQGDFFGDPTSIDFAKRKMDYVLNRWGYSANLLAIELVSEIDNIGGAEICESVSMDGGFYLDFFDEINNWVDEMGSQVHQYDPTLLVTTGVVNDYFAHKSPLQTKFRTFWDEDEIDFTLNHEYGTEKNYFSKVNAIIGEYEDEYGKPHQVGEMGAITIKNTVYSHEPSPHRGMYAVLHNLLWTTTMSGNFMAGVNWFQTVTHETWPSIVGQSPTTLGQSPKGVTHFQRLSAFFEDEPLANRQWITIKNKCDDTFLPDFEPLDAGACPDKNDQNEGISTSNDTHLQTFGLKEANKERVLGWIHFRDHIWLTSGFEPDNTPDPAVFLPPFGTATYPGKDPQTEKLTGETMTIEDLSANSTYLVEFWNTWPEFNYNQDPAPKAQAYHNQTVPFMQKVTSDGNGNLTVPLPDFAGLLHPQADQAYYVPDYGFKVTLINCIGDNVPETMCPAPTTINYSICGATDYQWEIGSGPEGMPGSNDFFIVSGAQTATPTIDANTPGVYYLQGTAMVNGYPVRFSHKILVDNNALDPGQIWNPMNPLCSGAVVTLDGTSPVSGATYQWQVTGPSGASYFLINPTSATPEFQGNTSGTYQFQLTITGCGTTYNKYFTINVVHNCNPARSDQDWALNVYPNPNQTGYLMVDLPANGQAYEVNILNNQGQLIRSQAVEGSSARLKLDISELAKGMYLVQLKGSQQQWTEKLLVQ